MAGLSFVSNDGTTWPFDGSTGVTVAEGDTGIFDIPADLVIEQRVGLDGGVLASSRYSPRAVVLSFMLEGEPSILPLWGSFVASLAAGGKFVYDGPNGVRELRQVCLEAPGRSMLGRDLQYRDVDVFTISFLALDPWWYGPAVEIDTPAAADDVPFNADIAFNANVPFNGGSSATFTVVGDTSANPRFVLIAGGDPMGTGTVTDGTRMWETTMSVTPDGAFEVDARPGSRGPHVGSDLAVGSPAMPVNWSLLTESSRVFDLPVGTTTVSYAFDVAGANAIIRLWYEPRWFTP
jgi:hypothetical protein